jgi:hypothetical protein
MCLQKSVKNNHFDFLALINGDGAQKIAGSRRTLKTLTDARDIVQLQKEIECAELCLMLRKEDITKHPLVTLANAVVDLRTKVKAYAPLRVHLRMVHLYTVALIGAESWKPLAISFRVYALKGCTP